MGFMATPVAAGDFNTYIKYDARAGRWFTKPDGGGELYEVTNMTAAVDLENIQTGWLEYVEGHGPVKVFDPSLSEAAPKPSDGARRGFQVLMFSEKNIGGLREFSSTAACVIEAMNEVYDEWEAGKAANPGKVPVVKCDGCIAAKSQKSTNYKPNLKIVSWTERPADLVAPEPVAPAAQAAPPAAAKPAAHTPPPAASAPPPPAMAEADAVEF